MPRLPTREDLGGLPAIGRGRPIARYDVSQVGSGAQALGRGLQDFGRGLGSFLSRDGSGSGSGDGAGIHAYEAEKGFLDTKFNDLRRTDEAWANANPDELLGRADVIDQQRQQRLDSLADSPPVQALRESDPAAAREFDLKMRRYQLEQYEEDLNTENEEVLTTAVRDLNMFIDERVAPQYQRIAELNISQGEKASRLEALNDELWEMFDPIPNQMMNPREKREEYEKFIHELHNNLVPQLSLPEQRSLNDVTGGDSYRVEPDSFPSFWTEQSILNSRGVDPALLNIAARAEAYLPPNMSFQVISGVRSEEEQRALFMSGRSPTDHSQHELARAIDIRPFIRNDDGSLSEYKTDDGYQAVANAMKLAADDLGYTSFRWGGDFKKPGPDRPHFDLGLEEAQFQRGERTEPQTNELRSSVIRVANELGIDPVALATVISYETSGTFDPWIPGGVDDTHIGLIQWSPENFRRYNLSRDMTISQQMDAVKRYLVDRGVRPGMGLLDVYSAINAGRVGMYGASDAANGGTWGTVADKVKYQMGGHIRKAEQLISGGGEIVLGSRGGSYNRLSRALWGLTAEERNSHAQRATSPDSEINKARKQQWQTSFNELLYAADHGQIPESRVDELWDQGYFSEFGDFDDYKKLRKEVRDYYGEFEELAQARQRLSQGGINRYNDDDRDAVNLVYEADQNPKALFTPSDNGLNPEIATLGAYMTRYGMVPEAAANEIRNAITSSDWGRVQAGMRVLDELVDLDRNIAFNSHSFTEDVRKLRDRYHQVAEMPEDKRADAWFPDSDRAAARNEQWRTRGEEYVSDDSKLRVVWPDSLSAEDPVVQADLRAAYKKLFPEAMVTAMGDPVRADKLVKQWLSDDFGQTNVSGSPRLMLYPPERHHPPGNYLFRQLQETVYEHDPNAQDWWPEPAPGADQQIKRGEYPSYWIFYRDASGERRFVPTPETKGLPAHRQEPAVFRYRPPADPQAPSNAPIVLPPQRVPGLGAEPREGTVVAPVLGPYQLSPAEKLELYDDALVKPDETIARARQLYRNQTIGESTWRTVESLAEDAREGRGLPRYFNRARIAVDRGLRSILSDTPEDALTHFLGMEEWWQWVVENRDASPREVGQKAFDLIANFEYEIAIDNRAQLPIPDILREVQPDRSQIGEDEVGFAFLLLEKKEGLTELERAEQERLLTLWERTVRALAEGQPKSAPEREPSKEQPIQLPENAPQQSNNGQPMHTRPEETGGAVRVPEWYLDLGRGVQDIFTREKMSGEEAKQRFAPRGQ